MSYNGEDANEKAGRTVRGLLEQTRQEMTMAWTYRSADGEVRFGIHFGVQLPRDWEKEDLTDKVTLLWAIGLLRRMMSPADREREKNIPGNF